MMGDEEFKNALYMIDIGQNDIDGLFSSLSSQTEVIKQIPSFISEINNTLRTIYYAYGGKKFWVHNTGPFGCLPKKLATIKVNNASTDLDDYGCLKSLNEAAQIFNTQLKTICEQLRVELKNATIVYVDIYSIKYSLISNSTLYGFPEPLTSCAGCGEPPYNYRQPCGEGEFKVCEEGSKYISWDGVHYTDAANAIVASAISSGNYSTPTLKFDYFCSP
ncbi:unnamed protein product [Cuscuta epithymum]|uniref:Uncharacterized protein n=1 Tax=Cuscuta epithymum TaxID=186058 RepID=A0AAV0EQ45_9ASTE|nr:unnamed protein product [Cuscuta epithymum]CAH9124884.1 unnamed protein product [Cuscuta epithymum]